MSLNPSAYIRVQRAVQEDGMVWYGVASSMIRAVGYDVDKRILDVAFYCMGVYRYFDVPSKDVEGLLDAEPKGSYMRAYIIDEVRCGTIEMHCV